MFERSFVDGNNDGIGVMYYDVGVSGDGLRGERRDGAGFTTPLLNYNPFSEWSADQNAAEQWALVNGVVQLVDGGKHYGHLEIDVERLDPSTGLYAKVTLTPVYSFPVLDANYNLLGTERRVYADVTTLYIDNLGGVAPIPEPGTWAMMLGGLIGLGTVARRRKA
jgi:hypothetical protein